MKYLKQCLECNKERVEKLILYRCPDCGAEYVSTWERWIKVEDRLPKENGRYLVIYQGITLDKEIVICLDIDDYDKGFGYPHVTHWMPPPELPEDLI